MSAIFEVGFQAGAQLGIEFALDEVGDLAEDLQATDLHGVCFEVARAHHGLTFLYAGLPVIQEPSKPGASASRIINRARSRRVRTRVSLMPSICAVSRMFRHCTSRSTKTSR